MENGQILGTIVASVLNYEQFKNQCGTDCSYVPCDGRKISADSKLGEILGKTTGKLFVPDLRGVFMRGLNMFDPAQSSEVTNGDPDKARIAGSRQEDAFKNHTHNMHCETGAAGGIGSYLTGDAHSSTQWGNVTGNTSSGDVETRPKNVAVYYYIKVN